MFMHVMLTSPPPHNMRHTLLRYMHFCIVHKSVKISVSPSHQPSNIQNYTRINIIYDNTFTYCAI